MGAVGFPTSAHLHVGIPLLLLIDPMPHSRLDAVLIILPAGPLPRSRFDTSRGQWLIGAPGGRPTGRMIRMIPCWRNAGNEFGLRHHLLIRPVRSRLASLP